MKQIIYNTQTNQLSRIYENGYNVPIPEHEQSFIHVLEVIDSDQPSYDPATQRISSEWVKDLEAKEYRKVWKITDRPAQEIALEQAGWNYPQYPLRIRVERTFLAEHPDLLVFKSWADINDLPFEKDETYYYLYCSEVLAVHQNIVDSFQQIEVQNIPT